MQNISAATTPFRRGYRFRGKENVTKGRRKYKGINSAARQYDRGEKRATRRGLKLEL
jgi:hypothetical protein